MRKAIIICFFSTNLFSQELNTEVGSQEPNNRIEYRWGVGTSALSYGDMTAIAVENELNYIINKYLSAGFSYNLWEK